MKRLSKSKHTKAKIDYDKLTYRYGVLGIALNEEGKILVIKPNAENITNQWKFPSGGIEKDETVEQAVLREFEEELRTNKFEIVKKSSTINIYDWEAETILITFKLQGVMWRGQSQQQFLLKFTGKSEDIKADLREVKDFKWVTKDDLPSLLLFPHQWERAKKVLDEFEI